MPGNRGRRWLFLWVLLAAGCAPDAEVVTARLALLELPSCEVGEVDRIVLRATGDFPTQERALPGEPPYAFDEFSPDTRWLGIEAQTAGARAGSLTALSGSDLDARALMLPLGRSCPLGDPLVFAPPGAAVAPLPGGGLLIAGGEVDGQPTNAAVTLPPGEVLARVPDAMLLRRAGASATRVGARVVIAGGAAAELYEVYDSERGGFDNAQVGTLAGLRRDHGAARLPDGRVLLVGGVPESGAEPLASAELIDLEADAVHTVDAEPLPRVAPAVLVLDSGDVLIALGKDADGAPETALERFSPEREEFELLPDVLPCHAEAALAALEGDRLLYVGCRSSEGCGAAESDPGCELVWLLPGADGFSVQPADLDARELYDLGSLRAVGLRDGRVLITGVGSAPGARRAFLIDPNGSAIQADVELSRVPAHLVALDDGMIAEVDAFGASLRREDLRSELDSPEPQVLPSGMLPVALDLPARWEQDHQGLLALERARFDLPFLRFADVRIELEVPGEGAAELLLEPEGAPAVVVAIDAERVALPGCSVLRASGAAITVERRGEDVLLRSGSHSARCSEPELAGRVGIALSAEKETRIAALEIERL